MSSPSGDFAIRSERLGEGAALLAVKGEIDLATAPRFAAALPPLTDAGVQSVIVDLGGVDFVDSSGISVLLNAQRRLTRAGGRLVLAAPTPNVLRMLQLVRLDSTFEIELTRDAAIARLDEPSRAGWRLVREQPRSAPGEEEA